MDRIDAGASVLVLVDYQARLMPAIHDAQAVTARAVQLARAARLLEIPVIGTQQNPQGLGPNDVAVGALCDATVTKTHFDACEDSLLQALRAARPGATQAVVAGCEAHVCMLQTALGLRRAGWRVWVVANASGSRRATDHAAAMTRLQAADITVVTHEMVLFEWLHDCRHPRFRDVLAIVKAAD